KRIQELVGFQIVFPDMTAPPLFGIFDFRKDPEGFDRLEHAIGGESHRRPGATDNRVEIIYSGLLLSGNTACVLRARRRHPLRFETELLLQQGLERRAQLGGWRNRQSNFSLLLGRLDRLVPLRRASRLRAKRDSTPNQRCNDKNQKGGS